jgi:hypothetical protein
MNKDIMHNFVLEIEKIAFMAPEQNKSGKSHKTFGQQISTIARHPISFAGHTVGGLVAGYGAGAIGGAAATAPLAAADAYMKRKLPGGFKGAFKERMGHGLTAEMVGVGLVGASLGANKFFKKYNTEK